MYQINDGQITVFGYPDGATLAQMQRTLENEHAAKGVLCADNHKVMRCRLAALWPTARR
jgi:hypothetical protein